MQRSIIIIFPINMQFVGLDTPICRITWLPLKYSALSAEMTLRVRLNSRNSSGSCDLWASWPFEQALFNRIYIHVYIEVKTMVPLAITPKSLVVTELFSPPFMWTLSVLNHPQPWNQWVRLTRRVTNQRAENHGTSVEKFRCFLWLRYRCAMFEWSTDLGFHDVCLENSEWKAMGGKLSISLSGRIGSQGVGRCHIMIGDFKFHLWDYLLLRIFRVCSPMGLKFGCANHPVCFNVKRLWINIMVLMDSPNSSLWVSNHKCLKIKPHLYLLNPNSDG